MIILVYLVIVIVKLVPLKVINATHVRMAIISIRIPVFLLVQMVSIISTIFVRLAVVIVKPVIRMAVCLVTPN